jgi:hypothetical protein
MPLPIPALTVFFDMPLSTTVYLTLAGVVSQLQAQLEQVTQQHAAALQALEHTQALLLEAQAQAQLRASSPVASLRARANGTAATVGSGTGPVKSSLAAALQEERKALAQVHCPLLPFCFLLYLFVVVVFFFSFPDALQVRQRLVDELWARTGNRPLLTS